MERASGLHSRGQSRREMQPNACATRLGTSGRTSHDAFDHQGACPLPRAGLRWTQSACASGRTVVDPLGCVGRHHCNHVTTPRRGSMPSAERRPCPRSGQGRAAIALDYWCRPGPFTAPPPTTPRCRRIRRGQCANLCAKLTGPLRTHDRVSGLHWRGRLELLR